MNWPRL